MNTKSFSLFAFSVLALVLAMSAVSAATLSNWTFEDSNLVVDSGAGTLVLSAGLTGPTYPTGNAPSPVASMSSAAWDVAGRYLEISLNTSGYQDLTIKFDEQISATGLTSFKIQYSSDGSTFTDLAASTTNSAAAFTANPMHTFDFSAIPALDNNANVKLRIVAVGLATDAAGTFRIDNILIEGTAIVTSSEPPAADLCNAVSNSGNLQVKKIDFANNGFQFTTFGEDDQWFLFEEIETQIDIKNNGNDDVDNVEISWGLWDTRNGQWVIEIDDETDLDIKDGDTESVTVTFSMDDDLDVDLDEIGDQNERYRLYVKAEGEVDNDASTLTCVSDFEPASAVIESDFVILDNIQVPETVQCGQTVQGSADVWNIGDNGQDAVSVEIFGRESVLVINEEVSVGDIDAFDSQRMDFTFTVPNDAEEKNYNLVLQVNDEDNEVFQNDFDDDYAEFIVPFKVSGGCGAAADSTSVAASLVSGGKAGQEMVISSTITNSGTSSATYVVSASDFAQWASGYEANPTSITIAAGSSGQVTFTFQVSKDASGQNTFYIELVSGNEVKRQPVSVSIEKAGLLSSITGAATGSNGLLWGLGILNVILIVAVILVAVRALRK